MKVGNYCASDKYGEVGIHENMSKVRQSDDQQKRSKEFTDEAVSVEISKRGLALAGELEPFIDTYETTRTLLKGTGHIGSREMINGDFADILADNYQNELQKLKENYSGKEYDEQRAILDKAYEEAARSLSIGYVKQLRLLTGDIVIKPQTSTISYASEAEAEKAYQEELKNNEKREPVIDTALAETMQDDIKNILLKLKNPDQNQQRDNVSGNFMSYADMKILGAYLYDGTYNNRNSDGISEFSRSLIERYAARTDE